MCIYIYIQYLHNALLNCSFAGLWGKAKEVYTAIESV